jgi:hypothetical protein
LQSKGVLDVNDREYTPSEIAKFKRAARALRELAESGAVIYLQEDVLHLMTGPSHDDDGRPRQDRSIASEQIPGSGGGGW